MAYLCGRVAIVRNKVPISIDLPECPFKKRTFLADAPMLILDEATSSLDSESEALIQQAMERLMKGRTSIVIAHPTVRSVDRIPVFDRGEIAEEANDAALVRPFRASGDGAPVFGITKVQRASHLLQTAKRLPSTPRSKPSDRARL
jgi:ABC-type multidrug transport system ATPase subunit